MTLLSSPEKITFADSKLKTGERPFSMYITEEQIYARTQELAKQILVDYAGRPIHLVQVALGGTFWATDLGRAIRRHDPHVRITHDQIRLESYGQGTNSSGVVRSISELGKPGLIENANVIIVDEVVDTGLTLAHMQRTFGAGIKDGRGSDAKLVRPESIAVAALTNKTSVHNGKGVLGANLAVNYTGFEVPDIWLVGCGMDHEQQGRELPAIYRSATPLDPVEAPAFTMPVTISPFMLGPVG